MANSIYIDCENSSIGIVAILKLLLINCVDCGDSDSLMTIIKRALVVDPSGNLYVKRNVDCGIRSGASGLPQLGIRILVGAEDTDYAECDQIDSWDSLAKRLVTDVGGVYHLNVV